MISPPHNHSWLATEDGSYTLFSERFSEGLHSTSGAKLETITHYVEGCDILSKAKARTLNILEVGWGLGIGYQTTIHQLLEKNQTPFLHFVSMELDLDLITWCQQNIVSPTLSPYPEISALEKKSLGNLIYFESVTEQGKLTILGKDARVSLPEFRRLFPDWKAGAIYQDAFSPKRNPTLWTVEWFELLKSLAADEVRLATYSASNSIRKSMIAAGWKVFSGARFGTKRASTRAALIGVTDAEIEEQLLRSPVTALRDQVDYV